MPRLCDIIEAFIKQMINDANGVIEIQRNELASQFKCVPSQINYVIDTRFTTDRGYVVESRRGGGGYIKINRMNVTQSIYLMHIVASLGESLTQQSAEAFINNFMDYDAISEREAMILKAGISDKVLSQVPGPQRDRLRTTLLKNMLASLLI